jgi:hypothetical protein
MSTKLVISNLDEVLAKAKLQKKGWKRDYDKEPWVEDRKEWIELKKLQRIKEVILTEEQRDLDSEESRWMKKNLYRRWRKRK